MILRAIGGSVELVGSRMSIGIPKSGDARYTLDPGAGGLLNVSWLASPCVDDQCGRVILVVPDGKGGLDELVITEPRVLDISADGTVALTLSEYVQASAALSAIPAKLGELEGRIAALEAEVSRSSEHPLPPASNQIPETGTYDPYAPGLGLVGGKD